MKLPVFCKKENSISINRLFQKLKSNIKIIYFATLSQSKKFDLTFVDSIKYKSFVLNTNSSFCITTEKLEKFLPIHTQKIIPILLVDGPF